MPAGTPSTSEPLMPMKIMPIARPRRPGGALSVASRVATRHTVALAAAMAIRAANSTQMLPASAAARLLAMNRTSATHRRRLRGTCLVSTSASGAVTAKVTEKTEVSCPASPIGTSRWPAISGRMPMTMFSAVPVAKVANVRR